MCAGAHPPGGRRTLVVADRVCRIGDEPRLVLAGEPVLVLGVGAAVGDDLVPAPAEGGDEIRAMVIALGVEENGQGQAVLLEQLDQPPAADAVAVLAPAPVVAVRMG